MLAVTAAVSGSRHKFGPHSSGSTLARAHLDERKALHLPVIRPLCKLDSEPVGGVSELEERVGTQGGLQGVVGASRTGQLDERRCWCAQSL